MSNSLIKLYRTKRALLEDAETKLRIAASQSRKEVELSGVAFYKIKKIEAVLARAEEHVKAVDILARKHLPKRHSAQKLMSSLAGLRSLHNETREIVDTLITIKKKAHRNIRHLGRDFTKITSIRKKMGKIIERN